MIKSNEVIMTCFAGRQHTTSVLFKYASDLIQKGHIKEFHVWNYAKDPKDDVWLKQSIPVHCEPVSIIQKHVYGYVYHKTSLTIRTGDMVCFRVQAKTNAQLLLQNRVDGKSYEITFGGFNNSKSTLCYGVQGVLKSECRGAVLDPDDFIMVKISVNRLTNELSITLPDNNIMSYTLPSTLSLFEVYVGSWDGEHALWEYLDPFDFGVNQPQSPSSKVKLMNVSNKNLWQEYYKHYNSSRYPNHVIIKCDDDVVFIDNASFEHFIKNRIEDDEHLLMFPSIINNEISLYYQVLHGIIPENIIIPVTYTPSGTGLLWGDGTRAQTLHEYFIEHQKDVIERSRKNQTLQNIKYNDRVSINFFAIKSRDLYVFQIIGNEDESELTQIIPGLIGRSHCFYMGMIVSHLSFAEQRRTGLDVERITMKYHELSDQMLT